MYKKYDKFINFDVFDADDTVINEINQSNKKYLLYNLLDPYGIYPLENNDGRNNHFFRILTKINPKKYNNIGICLPDINLFDNYRKIKKKMFDFGVISDESYNTKIDIFCYPWGFFQKYYTDKDFELSDNKIDIKNHIICLSGGRKVARLLLLSELSKYDNFVYSNTGYDDYIEDLDFELDDIIIDEDYFLLKQKDKIMKCTGDEIIENYHYTKNNFDSFDIKRIETDYSLFKLKKKYDILNDDPKFKYDLVPRSFLEAAVCVNVETQTTEATHITEKTVKNIFYKKVFINFSGRNFYRFLKSFGFEYYTEFFDYSFDSQKTTDRFSSILSQIKTLLEMDTQKLIDTVKSKSVEDKINNNYCCFKEIIDILIYNIGNNSIKDIFNKKLESCITNKLIFHEKI